MVGAIAAVTGIIMAGAEVVAITMVGGIIAIIGDFTALLGRGRSVAAFFCVRPSEQSRLVGTHRAVLMMSEISEGVSV